MMEEENMGNITHDIEDRIGKAIPQAKVLLEDVEVQHIALKTSEEASVIYEEFASDLVEIERDIKKTELDLKVVEIMQQRVFKAKGVKTVKEQEQLTREAMLDARRQLENYKEVRDKLRVKRFLFEYVIMKGDVI